MSKVKSVKLMILAMIVLFILVPFIGQSSIKPAGDDMRPDRLVIQHEGQTKKDEMPAVGFLHDLHTDAVEGDCNACHEEQDKALVFKFKRTAGEGSMDFYHDQCVACHVEKKSAGEPFGPMAAECRSCHMENGNTGSSWHPIKFDKSLHYVHEKSDLIKATDPSDTANCSRCHHKYNEKSNEIFYTKGEEEACAYCHQPVETNKIRPIRNAAHDACVSCHMELKRAKAKAGPTICNGCHDLEMQQQIEKVAEVPRLKRNQPDIVAITVWEDGAGKDVGRMNAVAFNHEFHEIKSESCKGCHHQTLKKCNDCHKPDGGDLQGGFVSLEQAMHKRDSNRSCIGCHTSRTSHTDCAGCHFIAPVRTENTDACKTCHKLNPKEMKNRKPENMAKAALKNMDAAYTPVPVEQIPEEIKIDILAKDYKPSLFPHRKVVQSIIERVEKSDMARTFHKNQTGLCMGCHHNSPRSLEPPKCASCHNKKGPDVDGRPGLKGAYHGQCITCHQQMKIEAVAATDCAKCHEEKR